MPATKRKDMWTNKFLLRTIGRVRQNWNAPHATFRLSTFLGLALLCCSFGCAPSSSPDDGQRSSSASAASDIPEITDEKIREEINDAYVRKVPEESGAGEPINWSFDEEEPKEHTIVEKQMEGERATIIIDIKTQSAPRSRSPKYLAGRIRTKWELQTGWALRTWEIAETENISLKYKNLPMPPAQNSNR